LPLDDQPGKIPLMTVSATRLRLYYLTSIALIL
jgi:hypothetical protein